MGWPTSQDYNEAIQSPARNFEDADLKRSRVVTNPLGLPMPSSGNFADVYQTCSPEGTRWAVKCFTRSLPGLGQRYREISRHLSQGKVPFTVDFTYLESGIRVAGQWYPVLKMEWVEGLTLSQFVAQHADKPTVLEALLRTWLRMAKTLQAARVGHGDLQHGNILVAGADLLSAKLRLVDYDGMWVPALSGTTSGEVGHPSFQHPQRLRDETYGPNVDRFPLLVIATALCALKTGGRALWDKYDNGDNLLFTAADLEGPTKSHLFLDLLRSADPLTVRLAKRLIDALRDGVESVPLLEDVLAETGPGAVPVPARSRTVAVPIDTPYASAIPPRVRNWKECPEPPPIQTEPTTGGTKRVRYLHHLRDADGELVIYFVDPSRCPDGTVLQSSPVVEVRRSPSARIDVLEGDGQERTYLIRTQHSVYEVQMPHAKAEQLAWDLDQIL